jgi:hypothetical protein
MAGVSDENVLTEYLVKYGALKLEKRRAEDFLEVLYIAERYQAGDELKAAKAGYDPSVWSGAEAADIDRRLVELDRFMRVLARQRALMWGASI